MSSNGPNSSPIGEISDICSAFFEISDGQKLLDRILKTAINVTKSERGTIFLLHRDKQKKDLLSFVATGLDDQKIKVGINEGVVGFVYKTKKPVIVNDAPNDPRFFSQIDAQTQFQTRNILACPIMSPEGSELGVLEVLNSTKGSFSDVELEYLRLISFFAGVALDHRKKMDSLSESNRTLKQNHQSLIEDKNRHCLLNSKNFSLQSTFKKIDVFSNSEIAILIQGESGTGKEVLAREIHLKSPRSGNPFVALNCSAIPESLFEAELFGVAKGAATGVVEKKGKVELANEGTLFLDEVGDMPLSMQSKLLRVLQEKEITRVGSESQPLAVDFRLIAATNKNLVEMIKNQTFREDLYYRLQGAQFFLLPLRERMEDLPDLCHSLIRKISEEKKIPIKNIPSNTMTHLQAQTWPGNLRQLENKLEIAMILSGDRKDLLPKDFEFSTEVSDTTESFTLPANVISLKDAKHRLEKELLENALRNSKGNKSEAAKALGITRQGLEKALRRLKSVA